MEDFQLPEFAMERIAQESKRLGVYFKRIHFHENEISDNLISAIWEKVRNSGGDQLENKIYFNQLLKCAVADFCKRHGRKKEIFNRKCISIHQLKDDTDGSDSAHPPMRPESRSEEITAAMQRAINAAPREHQAVLNARFIAKMSIRDTATTCGMTYTNTHNSIKRLTEKYMRTSELKELLDL